jgi:hypothetical protein
MLFYFYKEIHPGGNFSIDLGVENLDNDVMTL